MSLLDFFAEAEPAPTPDLPADPHARRLHLAEVLWDGYDESPSTLRFGEWIDQQTQSGRYSELAREYRELQRMRAES